MYVKLTKLICDVKRVRPIAPHTLRLFFTLQLQTTNQIENQENCNKS